MDYYVGYLSVILDFWGTSTFFITYNLFISTFLPTYRHASKDYYGASFRCLDATSRQRVLRSVCD